LKLVPKVLIESLHKEDIKAAIRKRYGSLAAFERAHKLGKSSVSEILRGSTNQRTAKAVEQFLQEEQEDNDKTRRHMISCNSEGSSVAHRQNEGTR